MTKELKPHDRTRRVMVGDVPVGGGAPVAVQSMLNAPADDVAANLAQIEALAEAGCEIVRMAIPRRDCLDAFEAVCAASPLPVVADIHFDARIAIEAAARGAAKLRINPGNIGGLEATREVIAAASAAGIPIRIGVNAGSLDDALAARDDLTLPEKLAASATEYVRFFEDECDFHDLVVSAKAHDVQTTIDTYRLLAAELPEVPLHIGVTEAGGLMRGTVKSAVGLGILLHEGIGDTLRVSLTADPAEEVTVAWEILRALGLRRRGPEIISCPTCGRTEIDLFGLARAVEDALAESTADIKVAVMGCVVNGPGEAREADLGVAGGRDKGIIFRKGEVIRSVKGQDALLAAFMEELQRLLKEKETH